jgi:tRNA (adenine22-N1)-methyltransferase
MNKLSKRLEVVSSFIKEGSKIVDIGCDHGLLSIYLAGIYKNVKIIASDVNKNALSSAINNVKKYNLEERIETRLGSGLDVVSPEEIDTVVIAGMGSNTIVGILKYSKDNPSFGSISNNNNQITLEGIKSIYTSLGATCE